MFAYKIYKEIHQTDNNENIINTPFLNNLFPDTNCVYQDITNQFCANQIWLKIKNDQKKFNYYLIYPNTILKIIKIKPKITWIHFFDLNVRNAYEQENICNDDHILKNIKIWYGYDDHYTNVTYKVTVYHDIILIPSSDKERNELFGDLYPNIIKHIIFEFDDKKVILFEDDIFIYFLDKSIRDKLYFDECLYGNKKYHIYSPSSNIPNNQINNIKLSYGIPNNFVDVSDKKYKCLYNDNILYIPKNKNILFGDPMENTKKILKYENSDHIINLDECDELLLSTSNSNTYIKYNNCFIKSSLKIMNKTYKNIVLYSYYNSIISIYNLLFFINNAIINNDETLYCIIINGFDCSIINLIQDYDNIIIIKRPNIGYDFGAWNQALLYLEDCCIDGQYYINLNASVIGPILPTYVDKNKWIKIFTKQINDQIKLVSTSAVITEEHVTIYNRKQMFVQSMFFVVDKIGIDILRKNNIYKSFDCKKDVIVHAEEMLSQIIYDNGYKCKIINLMQNNIDLDIGLHRNYNMFTTFKNGYDGINIDPFDCIFFKWYWQNGAKSHCVSFNKLNKYVKFINKNNHINQKQNNNNNNTT